MPIEVETKDCTSLSDGELTDMGDISAEGPARYDIGVLSKQREEWVLATLAHEDGALVGFAFSTLERIGGTPSILLGPATIARTVDRTEVLRRITGELFRRAVLAFPDEDVLLGVRLAGPSGFEAFSSSLGLQDVVPRPDHKATGEERAWGRRLAKRFAIDAGYDDRTFRVAGEGVPSCVLDHEAVDPGTLSPEVVAIFEGLDPSRGDALIAFGWAMAEDLAEIQPR
jgi:hypothetical protein